ncbi:hypothetical protein [Microtetraspora fusca]|uniref:Uncharacterized protein n=1 Tax=Microtetraspora fusca TaxID=1997 RepID=A0ABW6VCH7_MICFU|nr:hypothetical protein [Microtetraspora fusca]
MRAIVYGSRACSPPLAFGAAQALAGEARLPHYSPTAGLVGFLVLVAVFIILVIAIARSRRR